MKEVEKFHLLEDQKIEYVQNALNKKMFVGVISLNDLLEFRFFLHCHDTNNNDLTCTTVRIETIKRKKNETTEQYIKRVYKKALNKDFEYSFEHLREFDTPEQKNEFLFAHSKTYTIEEMTYKTLEKEVQKKIEILNVLFA